MSTKQTTTTFKLFIFITASLLCLGLLLFNWTAPISNAARSNLLTNGTFDSDTSSWWLVTGNGAAASMSIINQELCVDITSAGVNTWDVIIGQSNVPLVASQLYTVDFTASTDMPRWFITKGGLAVSPYTGYFHAQEYLQSSDYQHSHQFFADTTDASSKFEFHIGGQTGQTCFDNVSLSAIAPTAAPTAVPTLTPTAVPAPVGTQVDLVKNGRFDDSLTHWRNSVGGNGDASVSIAAEELTYTIAAEGDNTWSLILLQKYLPLTQGFSYTVSFDARANADRWVNLKVGQATSPYASYGSNTILVTTSAQTFTHTFTMNHASDNCVNLEFHLGARGTGSITFDNIKLETDTAAVPPPSSYVGQTAALTGYPLRWHGQQTNVDVGAAVSTAPFHCDDTYRQTLAREYDIITAEGVMKFGPLHPAADLYDFGEADNMMEFAEQHNMDVHGHVLVWHSSLPDWVENGSFTRQEMIDVLYDHIDTVLGRYAGKIKVWDVVNEAIDDTTYGLRSTPWLNNIGTDYIDLAFQRARQADPSTLLVYNDYGISGLGAKSNAVYNLVADMVGRGIPIDGVGFQMHLWLLSPPDPADMAANMARYDALGIDVYITELDISIEMPVTYSDLVNQATLYKLVLQTCLEAPNCHHVTTWGFTDAHSWIPGFFPGRDEGLPFDTSYGAKPAYHALIETFNQGSAPLTAVPDTTDIVLNWPGGTASCTYQLYRTTQPHQAPVAGNLHHTWTSGPATFRDSNAATAGSIYFYKLQTTVCPQAPALSNEIGAVTFAVVPGS
ncbi:MAG: endo-1,4-beta-xylanase [Chloroflexota bacterium]